MPTQLPVDPVERLKVCFHRHITTCSYRRQSMPQQISSVDESFLVSPPTAFIVCMSLFSSFSSENTDIATTPGKSCESA